MELTREDIVGAFREIGDILHRRRKIGDIAVFGGSAMLLQFSVDFVTDDVDAVIESEHGEVIRAVQELAEARGWRPGWLSEAVSVYLSAEHRASLQLFGEFPSPERVGLRVYVAKPEYLLALKLRALRMGTRDMEDVLTLARHLNLRTVDHLLDVLQRNFPNMPLDTRRRILIGDLVRQIEP